MHAAIPIPPDLTALAARQAGILLRPQVLANGGTQSMINRLLRTRTWRRIAQGVYARDGHVTFLALCHAGLLLARPGGVIGGRAAGHLYGVCSAPQSITVWGDQSRTQGPWRFRRGELEGAGDPARLGGDDAVLESCAESRTGDVPGILVASLRSRMTTPERLRERALQLDRLPRRALILRLLPRLTEGIESPLEDHFLQRVQRAHLLPEGLRQKSLSPGSRSDIVLEEFRLVIELDGRLGHEGEGAWRDYERDNRHLLLGYSTLRFGWHDVALRPCRVAGQVASVLLQRGWKGTARTGTARRCSRNCTVASSRVHLRAP